MAFFQGISASSKEGRSTGAYVSFANIDIPDELVLDFKNVQTDKHLNKVYLQPSTLKTGANPSESPQIAK